MDINIYKGAIGINNKVTPHRLPFSEGVSALESATDVIIDTTGEVITRSNSNLLIAGEYHSSFRIGNGFLVAKDSYIYKATPTTTGALTFDVVVSNLSGGRVYYTKIADTVYYSNGEEHGIIEGLNSEDWPVGEWRLTDRSENKVQFPAGKHLEVISGRIVQAIEDELIFTEYAQLGIYDEVANVRRFEDEITMICSVQTGLFVSCSKGTYFVTGIPLKIEVVKVFDYQAYNHCQDLINPFKYGFDTSQLSCMMATVRGPVIGFPDGSAINLIENNIDVSNKCGINGSIMVVDSLILQSN